MPRPDRNFTVQIALLGWGSLLWDEDAEFDQWHGLWLPDGPILNIEFSRISQTRNGALTLVIDNTNGSPTQVAYCLSKRTGINVAIEDLKKREKTGSKGVGWLNVTGDCQYRDQTSMTAIKEWAASQSLDCVVWTDLQNNFVKQRQITFSVEAATTYINSLGKEGQVAAHEYLAKAPDFVQTPLRKAFAGQ